MRARPLSVAAFLTVGWAAAAAWAQAVCLPAPRLLTTTPMGGQVGRRFEVAITGDNLEHVEQLSFSHKGITAAARLDEKGAPIPNRFVVSIAPDCPQGVHEARVMTRLGVSSSRAFSVGSLREAVASKPHTTLKTAIPLEVNSVCNAVMTRQAIDYYALTVSEGQRIVVECAAQGIDSKLKPVVILADEEGADLQVERRGGLLDFTARQAGRYTIKVHDLTYNGGSQYFYRLAVRAVNPGAPAPRLPSTRNVNAFSWPPHGLPANKSRPEVEPNNAHEQAEKISLPCDIRGRFFPAADIDTFEFTAKKGDVWWVEVASERLGLATDPAIVVQHVSAEGKLTDVAEFNDIPSPVKVSSNGYSYDGPPYNAGSADIIGKLVIKRDGLHRLRLRDLFGGTRSERGNIYRLIVRKAAPDFALVGWALHMGLRNGDRNALSKPLALRGGTTMAIEIVRIGRDGFNQPIDLYMENLPAGVKASAVKIPAGQSRGVMLITAAADAPRGLSSASIYGRSRINGKIAIRRCRLASMKWPVPDASQEIPAPRLLADIPVSVSGAELAPLTISPGEDKIWEAKVGGKLTIPLVHTRRCQFSGASIRLKTWGCGIGNVPAFDAPLNADASQAVLDLAALKTPPGEYVIAFYGSAVAKYRYHPEAVRLAKLLLAKAQKEADRLAAQSKEFAERARSAPASLKGEADRTAKAAVAKHKSAAAAVTAARQHLRTATARARPKDIVDIVVSTPIKIRVKPAE